MKIGVERVRLNERLAIAADTRDATDQDETQESEVSASINTALRSFRVDLASSLNAALSTIEGDMAALSSEHRRRIIVHMREMAWDLKILRQATQIGPCLITALLIATIAASVASALSWKTEISRVARRDALLGLGINAYETERGTVLLIDTTKLQLVKCRVQGPPVTCLRPVTPRR